MTTATDTRQSAQAYTDIYTKGEDPNGEQAEELCSDEIFCELAHALNSVETQHDYNSKDMSDLTRDKVRETKRQLQQALESRADTLLKEYY